MKKLVDKNQGFSIIEFLLVLFIIGLIGCIGLYIWRTNESKKINSDSVNLTNSNQSDNNNPQIKIQTDKEQNGTDPVTNGWYLFESPDKEYSLRLPNGLNFNTYAVRNVEAPGLETNDILDDHSDKLATVDLYSTSELADPTLNLDLIYNQGGGVIAEGDEYTTFTTNQGIRAVGYKFIEESNTKFTYIISKEDKHFTVIYTVKVNQDSKEHIVESMVKTLTL